MDHALLMRGFEGFGDLQRQQSLGGRLAVYITPLISCRSSIPAREMQLILPIRPLNNDRVVAQVKAPSGQISSLQLDWDVEKKGVYATTFKPQEKGIYEVSAEAFQGNKSLGTMKTNFRIAVLDTRFPRNCT
jgi:hypothetical protein